MKLRMAFHLTGPWKSSGKEFDLPMEFPLEPDGRYWVRERPHYPRDRSIGEEIDALLVVGTRSVDAAGMELVDDIFQQELPDGTHRPAKAITCPEVHELTEGAHCLAGALGLDARVPFELSPLIDFHMPNRFVAENHDDRELLKSLGRRVRPPVWGSSSVEVFDSEKVDAGFVRELARRRVVRVYSEAMQARTPSKKYRDLWRTLEFAFQAHDKELSRLITAFPPAQRLGFDYAELESLRALRGRLGHAASRPGGDDVARFDREATVSLGRLWSLVDWVVITKKEPSRSLAFDALRPLSAFITREGRVRVLKEGRHE